MCHFPMCVAVFALARLPGVASAVGAPEPASNAQLDLPRTLEGLERRYRNVTVMETEWEDYLSGMNDLPPHDGVAHSEHGGHDAAGHEMEEAGHAVGHANANHESRSVAVGLIATIILTPIGMHLLLTPGVKKYVMLKMLDQCMAIFVAVLWYTAFSSLIQYFNVYEYIPLSVEILSFSQVIVLNALFLYLAKCMSHGGSRRGLASPRTQTADALAPGTICSLGAHYVAFTAIGAGGHLQKSAAENVEHGGWMYSIGVMLVVMVLLLLLGGLFELLVIGSYSNYSEEWIHTTGVQIDEMQMEILGLVGSFLIIQAVRHGITGRYPPLTLGATEDAHGGHSAHDDYTHKAWQRTFMLFWSIGFSIVAMYAVPKLNRAAGDSRNTRKVVHGLKVLLIMLVAWGYLLWGEWVFYETMFHGDPMFGHMVFALIATGISFGFVFFLSGALEKNSLQNESARAFDTPRLSGRSQSSAPSIKQSHGVTITGVSLLTAWSWEHCFHIAFDIIGEEYQMGYNGLIPKLSLAILIPSVLLPVYVKHVKPRVLDEERNNDPDADIVA